MPPRKRRNRDEEEDDEDEDMNDDFGEEDDDDDEEEVMPSSSSSTRTPQNRRASSRTQNTPSTSRKASSRNSRQEQQEEKYDEQGMADLGDHYEMDRNQFSHSALGERSHRYQEVIEQIRSEQEEHTKQVDTALKELDKSGLKNIDLHKFVGSLPGSDQLQNELLEASRKLEDTQWQVLREQCGFEFDTARHIAAERAQANSIPLVSDPYNTAFQNREEIPGDELDAEYQRRALNLASKIEQVQEGGDIVVQEGEETEASFKCPVTQRVMATPMKTPCGHYMDRQSVSVIFSAHGTRKCPQQGCNRNLQKQDLQVDHEMAQKIKRWKRKRLDHQDDGRAAS
eukprot:gb/GECG01005880.1/.p1 GENE.gb/GECG01005880.1/~~gb/GECG01005880.1/.p1  ORF type:complete len:341 (+),score=78.90 gb/GECG01005880.1/:1-1023(+)